MIPAILTAISRHYIDAYAVLVPFNKPQRSGHA